MCEDCGCLESEKKIIVNKSVTQVNDLLAHQIYHNLQDKKVICINLMGAPGSGKTTFIEGLISYIPTKELVVIQGDLESDIDKIRLKKLGVNTYQINTHSGCHLNAEMINKALLNINFEGKKYLIIENVGNLVCPAGVQIGQHMDIVVSSTAEGYDKPKKYPIIYLNAKLIIISKYDIKDAVDFDEEKFLFDIKNINSKAKIVKTTSKDKESFKEAAFFFKHQREHIIENKHSH
jgi:hydrogenase nickel incorporation protein HypB